VSLFTIVFSPIAREGSTVSGPCHHRSETFTRRSRFIIGPAMRDPMPLRGQTAIPLSEIELRASRSSGPGGQHANKTSSRIEASFDVAASGSLSDEQKRRIIARLGPRVVTVAQDARSQTRNRELALERMAGRLSGALTVARPRRATRPSKASVQRRLATKRHRADRKRDRRRPVDE
jgi:ribosome-associated protein